MKSMESISWRHNIFGRIGDAMVFPVFHPVEDRFILLAKYRKKLWAAVFTPRNNRTRIISVRRARKNEERHYNDNE